MVPEYTNAGYTVTKKIYSYEVSGDTIIFTTCVATHNGNDKVYDEDNHAYYYTHTDCTYTLVSQRLFHMENIILIPYTESRIQESMSHTEYLISSASYQDSEFKSLDYRVK